MRWFRPIPLAAMLLTAAALVTVILLGNHADASRREQLRAKQLTLALTDLQSAPFNADRRAGGSPAAVRAQVAADERTLREGLAPGSQLGIGGAASLEGARIHLAEAEAAARRIFAIAASPSGLTGNRRIPALQLRLSRSSEQLAATLDQIDSEFAQRAERARTEAEVGAAVALLALLAGFAFFYDRSHRARARAEGLAEENRRLLHESRREALTDELTGLGNRRALMADLDAWARSDAAPEMRLAMFDLDGFKQYNDTFGHAAGDELLARFGRRLGAAQGAAGSAYRMGGDEFCVVVRNRPDRAGAIIERSVGALTESGPGWRVGASCGAVRMPAEAATPDEALRIADRRMYADKAARTESATAPEHRSIVRAGR
jgi:diguanylate cyclase (GGDEF)-like protein